MKTLHYGGTAIRVSDELAGAIQSYSILLRHRHDGASWRHIPGYPRDSDDAQTFSIQFVARAPMVIAPSYPVLPDAPGSAEVVAELENEIAKFAKELNDSE